MTSKEADLFATVAITKHHRLGGSKDQNLFSHSSEGWTSKIKVLAGLVPPEVFLLGLQMPVSLLCPHMAFSLSAHPWSSSFKDTSHVGLGPALMIKFNLNYLFKGPIPQIQSLWGLWLQHRIFRGNTIQSIQGSSS